jgi:hypothetical protein
MNAMLKELFKEDEEKEEEKENAED